MSRHDFQIVTVASGARSLRSLQYQETFHPVVGPMVEARILHVEQQQLLARADRPLQNPFVIWDVGLGAAANAIAVLSAFQEAMASERPVELHSFDRTLDALDFALEHSSELGYLAGWEGKLEELIQRRECRLGRMTWRYHPGDFRDTVSIPSIPSPHAVIFDPYSPAANPEIWTVEIFAAIREREDEGEGTLLTTYSRSTAVRVTLLEAGWFVGCGEATGEKEETTIAASRVELLLRPLEADWLGRVARSSAPGPLSNSVRFAGSAREVAERLREHPQFIPAGDSGEVGRTDDPNSRSPDRGVGADGGPAGRATK